MISTSTGRALRRAFIVTLMAGAPGAVLAAGSDDGHTHTHAPAAEQAASEAPEHTGHAAAQLHAGAALIGARQLYIDRCAACHGKRGQGTEAVAIDFSEPEALVRLTRETMSATLGDGHGGRLDAALAEADRETIIGYLRSYLMLPAPDADTDIGRAIYSRDCSVCHGDRGDAASWAKNSLDPAPAAFTAHGLEQLSRESMIDTVTFGAKDSAMMPFTVQLSNEEIAATVDYIRAAFMPEGMGPGGEGHDHGEGHDDHGEGHAAGHAGGAAEDAPFPAGLVGDPVWGKEFYNANCAECHGPKGDGQGRRAYFMIVQKPENFLSREARAELDRPKLFGYVNEGVVGTTMPAWNKVLTQQEIANVAEYVYRAFLNPDRFAAIEAPAAPGWQATGTDPAPAKKN
ncbi:MAG: c-type cytochrome [Alphaproteobacteria bacterium]